jgi:DNA-binding transcriptional MerR regulator
MNRPCRKSGRITAFTQRIGMEKVSLETAPSIFYGIGEVESILRVKSHVIRYWEKEIPLIQPEKNKYNGRMRYSQKDIQLLLRLKYLLYDKKFTVEGAREQLYRELSDGDSQKQELRAEIASLRSDLLDIYFLNRSRR